MIDIDAAYFEWLTGKFGETDLGFVRVCKMLSNNVFQRRVGRDVNRAVDGEALRDEFIDECQAGGVIFDHSDLYTFMHQPCNWFEMLAALCIHLDFTYDQGLQNHFVEIITNVGLDRVMVPYAVDRVDQDMVDSVCNRIDFDLYSPNGHGGLFPLNGDDYFDQRAVEIWDQAGAYFREKLEGVMWTSTP